MAEYQGRKVPLNKPLRISKGEAGYGRKKKKVFVKTGNKVKKVMFGDPNMKIRKNEPGRRSNFRKRHSCDSPGPNTSARYWSCKAW